MNNDEKTIVEHLCPEGMVHFMTLQADEDNATAIGNSMHQERHGDAIFTYVQKVPNKANNPLFEYDDLLRRFLDMAKVDRHNKGSNRTGTDTYRLFSEQIRIPLQEKFPWPTRKKISFKQMKGELAAFLNGASTVEEFQDNGCKFWDPWGTREHLDKNGLKDKPEGYLGPIYGVQWSDFGGVNQLDTLVSRLQTHPMCRRHIVSAWNPPQLKEMALPPCHLMFQCWYNNDLTELSMHMLMRSADIFVGVPFNIGSYALLLHLLCDEINSGGYAARGVNPGELVITMVDCHMYDNHVDAVETYLSRDVREFPTITVKPGTGIYEFRDSSDVILTNYMPHPHIPVDIAV